MIYLDSSDLVKRYIEEEVLFVASDLELLKAARAEKLRVLNPQS